MLCRIFSLVPSLLPGESRVISTLIFLWPVSLVRFSHGLALLIYLTWHTLQPGASVSPLLSDVHNPLRAKEEAGGENKPAKPNEKGVEYAWEEQRTEEGTTAWKNRGNPGRPGPPGWLHHYPSSRNTPPLSRPGHQHVLCREMLFIKSSRALAQAQAADAGRGARG